MTFEEMQAFIRANTTLVQTALLPEISLHLASELTPLWHATAATIAALDITPYWAFAWAGGQALARHILDHPELVRGRRVFDFGSGSGIVAIAAAKAGATAVTAADIDPFFPALLALNAAANGVSVRAYAGSPIGEPLPDTEVLLSGDMFYEGPLASEGMAWFRTLAARGVLVLAGDPGRIYSPKEGLEPCARYRVPTTTEIEDATVKETRVLRVVPL